MIMSIKELVIVSPDYLSGLEFTSREAHKLSPKSHKVSISTALSRMCDQGFLDKRLEHPENEGSRIIAHFKKSDKPPVHKPIAKGVADTDPMVSLWARRTWVSTPTSDEFSPKWVYS
jgi:hypothetical protein